MLSMALRVSIGMKWSFLEMSLSSIVLAVGEEAHNQQLGVVRSLTV